MADYYLREDFGAASPRGITGAGSMLEWAQGVAARARSEDIYRDKEGR